MAVPLISMPQTKNGPTTNKSLLSNNKSIKWLGDYKIIVEIDIVDKESNT